jgi:N-acetylglucosaminyl-diphospho-decaprenol L-rhamnosyltransferase
MSVPPDLSIVILNYNSARHVRRLLASLDAACAGVATERIVVDNASPRPGIGPAVAAFPEVRLIRRLRNGGFSAGVNDGIRAARAPYVLVLNPDTVPAPGSIAALLAHARANPDAGIVGPKLVNPDGSLQLSCRRFPSLGTALFNRYSLLTRLLPGNRLSASYLMTDWDHASTRDVDWLSGAAMLLNRAALDRTGPFDERYFFAIEDVDLCRRMHAAGYRVVYHPEAVVMHRIGGSSRTAPARVVVAWHAGMWRYYRTYMSHGPLIDALAAAAITARAALQLARVALRR